MTSICLSGYEGLSTPWQPVHTFKSEHPARRAARYAALATGRAVE